MAYEKSARNRAGMKRFGIAIACLAIAVSVLGASCGGGKSSKAKSTSALNEGLKAHRAGKTDLASEKYREALKRDPNNKWALYNLGLIDQTLGRPREAELKYRQVLRLDIQFTPALFNLAILRAPEAPQEAAQLYQEVVKVTPGNADAWWNLGFVLRTLGQTQDADLAFAKAGALNPKFAAPPSAPTTTPTSAPAGRR